MAREARKRLALMFLLNIFYNAETECEEILRKNAGFNKCYEKFPNVWPSHSFWPIPFIHPNQVCNERTGLKECQMEVVTDCVPFTGYTHASFNSLLNKAWSSIFCNNMV
ncbi:uncharacterized protein LOC117171975 [Belonocnema kinseyi]|uniref:uncharacterized protein LOC117171975 n=1 Tax=Belonocnema kinseyi TaxID=2817044 RepID=UPI00143D6F0A|nr:uncharacterized protein LOC117171975 [Belonocnema kinseyi]